jgi:Protein of unknown function (DUF1822)
MSGANILTPTPTPNPYPLFPIMLSIFADPSDWILEISPDRRAISWQQSQTYRTDWGRWNADLNHACLDTILPWLQAEYLPTATTWIESSQLPLVWQLINGSIITIGTHRIALIPTEAIDRSELEVPQEWVDIPSWMADYYLGVQIAGDGSQLQIYGFVTHQQLKNYGSYDCQDRTYCLSIDEMNSDLNALWLALDRYTAAETRAAIAPIPALTSGNISALVERLSSPDEILPRLAIPFELWAAILESPESLQQLDCQRQIHSSITSNIAQLSNWLAGQIAPIWQALDRVLLPQQLAIAVRSPDLSTQPPSDLYRAKVYSLATGQIALIVGLTPIADRESRIVLQLHPAGGSTQLPAPTRLRLLTIDGNEIAQASAAVTETIQIQFRASAGERFQVEIECAGQVWLEIFDR